jgi:hypothetical protein
MTFTVLPEGCGRARTYQRERFPMLQMFHTKFCRKPQLPAIAVSLELMVAVTAERLIPPSIRHLR